jgi:hypothetical protein
MKIKFLLYLVILLLFIKTGCEKKMTNTNTEPIAKVDTFQVKFAGVRSSSYGIDPFPDPAGWGVAMNTMSSYFEGAKPCAIWIVGEIWGAETCHLFFPSDGKSYRNISFQTADKHDLYLTYFDQAGLNVFLQVESADASVSTLIDIILNRYKHHQCVVGFGVDVEWYRVSEWPGWGIKVLDDSAQVWEDKVKSHNENYRLFLKHWDRRWMPPTYKGDIIFVTDSQGFNQLDDMLEEFDNYWADYFYPNPVYYQYGYQSDKKWWENLENPPKYIGDAITERIEQDCGFFWVDFTLRSVLPVTP